MQHIMGMTQHGPTLTPAKLNDGAIVADDKKVRYPAQDTE